MTRQAIPADLAAMMGLQPLMCGRWGYRCDLLYCQAWCERTDEHREGEHRCGEHTQGS